MLDEIDVDWADVDKVESELLKVVQKAFLSKRYTAESKVVGLGEISDEAVKHAIIRVEESVEKAGWKNVIIEIKRIEEGIIAVTLIK